MRVSPPGSEGTAPHTPWSQRPRPQTTDDGVPAVSAPWSAVPCCGSRGDISHRHTKTHNTRARVHTHLHTCTHIHAHTLTTQTHTYTQHTCSHIYIYTTHTYTRTCSHKYTHAHAHTHIHLHVYTHLNILIETHTYILTQYTYHARKHTHTFLCTLTHSDLVDTRRVLSRCCLSLLLPNPHFRGCQLCVYYLLAKKLLLLLHLLTSLPSCIAVSSQYRFTVCPPWAQPGTEGQGASRKPAPAVQQLQAPCKLDSRSP